MAEVFEVEWTGNWPSLCCGEWVIKYKGELVRLPDDVVNSSMGTEGEYQSWHFEDWVEVFDHYHNGIGFTEWLHENPWASEITSETKELQELFSKIQDNDWRHGSCGGCI